MHYSTKSDSSVLDNDSNNLHYHCILSLDVHCFILQLMACNLFTTNENNIWFLKQKKKIMGHDFMYVKVKCSCVILFLVDM